MAVAVTVISAAAGFRASAAERRPTPPGAGEGSRQRKSQQQCAASSVVQIHEVVFPVFLMLHPLVLSIHAEIGGALAIQPCGHDSGPRPKGNYRARHQGPRCAGATRTAPRSVRLVGS